MSATDSHPPERESLDPEVDAVDLMPELTGRAWIAALKRTIAEFKDDELLDRAAALTFFALLSLFPALLVMVALLGIFGQYPQTIDSMAEILTGAGVARDTVDSIRTPVDDVVRNTGGAGALLGIGLVGAIWSAAGYVGAFRRAANAVYEVEEGRPFWKLRPLQIALTIGAVLSISLIAFSIALTGAVARSAGDVLGIGDATVTAWNIVKWPVLLIVASLIVAVLFWATPNVKQQFHLISARQRAGAGRLDRRDARVLALPLDHRLLQQDLRHARRSHRAAGLVVAVEHRAALRRRAQQRG